MAKLYMNLMGYTTRRPANFPVLDRRAVMVEAHRIAKRVRSHYASYRAALAYGLDVAWKSNWTARVARSVTHQVSQATAPAPLLLASPIRRRPMLGHYA